MLSTLVLSSSLISIARASYAPAQCEGLYRTTVSVTQTNWMLEDGSVSTALPEAYKGAKPSVGNGWGGKSIGDYAYGGNDVSGYDGYAHAGYDLSEYEAKPEVYSMDGHAVSKQYEQKGKTIDTWEQLDPDYDGWWHGAQLWKCPEEDSDHETEIHGHGSGNGYWTSEDDKAANDSDAYGPPAMVSGTAKPSKSGEWKSIHSGAPARTAASGHPGADYPEQSMAPGHSTHPHHQSDLPDHPEHSASLSQAAPSNRASSGIPGPSLAAQSSHSKAVSLVSPTPSASVSMGMSEASVGRPSSQVSSKVSDFSKMSMASSSSVPASVPAPSANSRGASSHTSFASSASKVSSSVTFHSSSAVVVPPAEVTTCPEGLSYYIQTTNVDDPVLLDPLGVNYVSTSTELQPNTDFTLLADQATTLTATRFQFRLVDSVCRLYVENTFSVLSIAYGEGDDLSGAFQYYVLADDFATPPFNGGTSGLRRRLTCNLVLPTNRLACFIDERPDLNLLSRDPSDGRVAIGNTPLINGVATFTLVAAAAEITTCSVGTRYYIQTTNNLSGVRYVVSEPDPDGVAEGDLYANALTPADATIYEFFADDDGACRLMVSNTDPESEVHMLTRPGDLDVPNAYYLYNADFSTDPGRGLTRNKVTCNLLTPSNRLTCFIDARPAKNILSQQQGTNIIALGDIVIDTGSTIFTLLPVADVVIPPVLVCPTGRTQYLVQPLSAGQSSADAPYLRVTAATADMQPSDIALTADETDRAAALRIIFEPDPTFTSECRATVAGTEMQLIIDDAVTAGDTAPDNTRYQIFARLLGATPSSANQLDCKLELATDRMYCVASRDRTIDAALLRLVGAPYPYLAQEEATGADFADVYFQLSVL